MTNPRKKSKPLTDAMAPYYQDDTYVAELLNSLLFENDFPSFQVACRSIAKARKISMEELAEQIHVSRKSAYNATSEQGHPEFKTINLMIHALGFKMQIVPLMTVEGQVTAWS